MAFSKSRVTCWTVVELGGGGLFSSLSDLGQIKTNDVSHGSKFTMLCYSLCRIPKNAIDNYLFVVFLTLP